MTTPPAVITARGVRTPRAAAVAGIVFSILFASSTILTKWAVPPGSEDAGGWVSDDSRRRAVSLGLHLLPFAGIAFLWFIGVLRDRIGHAEDRFFATVFLGSGLLFVAMYFAAGAVAVGLMDTAAEQSSIGTVGPVWPFGRHVAGNLAFTYGLRMAAVFTISTTTIASRLDLMPRWLALAGYSTAAVLLFGVGFLPWLDLVFPTWVFLLSTHILVVTFRGGNELVRDLS
jgi:hypothetical protein